MNTLANLINTYATLSEQETSIKSQKESIKSQIVSQMTELGATTITTSSGRSASITDKTHFKYTDEDNLILTLFEDGYRDDVLETRVITTAFNNLLKADASLKEKYQRFITESVTKALTVK